MIKLFQSVNEMLDNAGIPLEIIDGFIGSISVSVPWTALLSDSCCLDIQGLELTIMPRQRVDTGLTNIFLFYSRLFKAWPNWPPQIFNTVDALVSDHLQKSGCN